MRVLALIIFLVVTFQGYGQTSDIEILDKAYDAQNPNESLSFLQTIKNPEIFSDSSINKFYLTKGIAYGKLGETDSSVYYLNRCVENAIASKDDYSRMQAHNSMGVLQRIQGKHEESLDAFQKALTLAESHDEESYQIRGYEILGNIGGIFYQLKDFEAAKNYTLRSLKSAIVFEDTSEIAYDYLRLAIVYQAQDSLNKSLFFNQGASQFLETLGDYTTLTYVENSLGTIYKKKGSLDSALIHQRKAKNYAMISGDAASIAHCTVLLGEIYFEMGGFEQAENLAEEGLGLAENGNFPIHSKNANDLLYRIALEKGQYEKAIEKRNYSIAISDSLNAAETRERLAGVEAKYETEKKEAEIVRLSLANDLKDANIARSQIAQYALATGGGLTILLLVVFFTLRHKKQQAEKEAQELQIEGLKERFIELHSSPSELSVALDFIELNGKLHTPLTGREFDILKLSLEGKTNTEIGEALFISISTVKFHLRNTYTKMGVGNRKEAFQYILKSS